MISMLFIRSKMMYALTIQGKDFELIEECNTECNKFLHEACFKSCKEFEFARNLGCHLKCLPLFLGLNFPLGLLFLFF